MSTTFLHTDIITPTLEHFRLHVDSIDKIPWEEKTEDRLLWRGRSTGTVAQTGVDWRNSQRHRLVALFKMAIMKLPTSVSFLSTDPDEDGSDEPPIEISATELNLDLMDISFGDAPVQCDSEVSQFMHERQSHPDGYKYRYVLDVDGNGWSARFKRLLLSQSIILKATVHPDWFTDRIQPWVHYVPVKVDFSDLYDIMTFFRGAKTSLTQRNHDTETSSEAKTGTQIAKAGTEWSNRFWRREDMDAYLLRLMLEYARVMSDDRDAMSFVYDKAIHGDPHLPA
ncbi:glycosyltransferase family 90 protein [Hydnum rufescens UP504]|uniref:Glycosyltransferase family 90 protein n=1 Tax=Hydnum rufescens UP504 TaxID=1448309 RepID=A0A9P6B782_9AGAM|nr:glycosyltransferase family 90 protein [Hydnum rufescens UP504]